ARRCAREHHPPGHRVGPRILDDLPQLQGDHRVQQLAPVRVGGVPAGARDRRRPRRMTTGPGPGGVAWLVLLLALAGCASAPKQPAPPPAATAEPPAAAPAPRKVSPYAPAQEDLSKRGDYTAGG